MGIDPRTVNRLLQLQIMSKAESLLSGSGSSGDGDSSLPFGEILQDLLGQTAGGNQGSMAPADLAGLLSLAASASGGAVMGDGVNDGLLPVSQPAAAANPTARLAAANLPHPSLSKPTAFDPIIRDASARYGVDPAMIKSVIDAESSFNAHSVSPAGAKGLMQLMDDTASGLGVTDSFDAEQNIHGGTKFLAYLLEKYNGNEATALAAYNAGPGRIDRLGIGNDGQLNAKYASLPSETQSYVRKVLDLKRDYQV